MKSVHANPPEKICRLCLSDSGVILPIFEGEVAERFSVPLPQKILSCLAIKVCADDPLPPHICHRCLYEVDRFHEFRETCKRTNTTFNKICNNSGESVPFDVNQVLEIKQELHDESVYHDAISELLSDDEGTDLGSSRMRKRNRCLSLLESMKRVQQAQSASSAVTTHSDQLPAEWMEQTKAAPSSESTTNTSHISTPLECRFCAKPFLYESSLLEHEHLHAKGVVCEDSSEHVEQIEPMEQQAAHDRLSSSPSSGLNPVSTTAPNAVSSNTDQAATSVPPTTLTPAPTTTPTPVPVPTNIHIPIPIPGPAPSTVPTPVPVPALSPVPIPTLTVPVSADIPTPTAAPAPAPASVPEPTQVVQQATSMEIRESHSQGQGQVTGSASHTTVETVSLTDVTAMLLEGAFDGVRAIASQASTLCRYCQEHFSNPDLLRRHERLYCNRKPSLVKLKQSIHHQSQQQIQQHSHSAVTTSQALAADTHQQHSLAAHHLVIQHQAAQHTEQPILFSQKVVVETAPPEPTRSCKHCHKDFIHRGSLWRHQMFCDSNPEKDLNRIVAGSKKKSSSIKNCDIRNEVQHMTHGGVAIPIPVHSVPGSLIRRGGIQTSSGPFKCKFCEKRFLHRGSWWRHQKMFCAVNPEIPTVKAEAKVQNSQAVPNFACRYCERTFLHRGSCWHHEQTHTGIKEHACRYCAKTFNEKSRLARHERMHLGIKPFSCRQCGKAFCDASNLRNHEQIHGERASFLCAWCGKSYTRRALLLKHEQVHASEGQVFNCSACPRTFPDPDTLHEHALSHSQERKRLYLCPSCGQTFRSQTLLSQHNQQSHQGQRQQIQQPTPQPQQGQEHALHTCNICSKAFPDVSSLRHHELLHSSTHRQYRCPNAVCNAVFHQQSQLDAHLLMHGSEKTQSIPSTVTVSSGSAFHPHQHPHAQPQQLLTAHEIQHQQTLQHHELLHREETFVIEGHTGQTIAVHHLVSQIPQ